MVVPSTLDNVVETISVAGFFERRDVVVTTTTFEVFHAAEKIIRHKIWGERTLDAHPVQDGGRPTDVSEDAAASDDVVVHVGREHMWEEF